MTNNVLLTLHESNNRASYITTSTTTNFTDRDINQPTMSPNRLHKYAVRDWTNVLGIAGLAGISTKVLSRSAARCAAAFGEGMTFATQPESQVTGPLNTVSFSPSDFPTSKTPKLCAEAPFVWNWNAWCPFPDCTFTDNQKPTMALHLRKKHHWDSQTSSLRALERLVPGTRTNSLHLDGFLQPIPTLFRPRLKRAREDNVRQSDGPDGHTYNEENEENDSEVADDGE
jgi:hypothetical protein